MSPPIPAFTVTFLHLLLHLPVYTNPPTPYTEGFRLPHQNRARLAPRDTFPTPLGVIHRFFPITNEFLAKDLALLLYDRIYPLHGLPLQIILDRRVQFAAQLF